MQPSRLEKSNDSGFIRPLADLLHDNSKGKFLTPDEKKRVQNYANEQRKKNKK